MIEIKVAVLIDCEQDGKVTVGERPPAARERDLYQPSSMVSAQAWWLGPRDPGEWTLGAAGVELAHGDLIGTKVPELQVAEPRVEFARQVASVVLSALKDDARARVGRDRLASRCGELAEVLVGQLSGPAREAIAAN